MQKRPYSGLIVFILLFVSANMQCTDNPLFTGGDIIPGNSHISGRISLSDQMEPENILVWLEGFDIAVKTDINGDFDMTLPVPAQQPNNGLTGVYNLYFYVADYWLNAAELVVLNGYVEDSKGIIGENGVLKETIELEKMLTIFTDLEPDKISETYSGTIFCRIFLQAARDSVSVITHIEEDLVTASFIVPQAGAVSEMIQYERTPVNPSVQLIGTEQKVWIMRIEFEQGMLREGDYEVVPYIVAMQPYIPPGLMNRLGNNVQQFDPAFLTIPFKRGGGMLHVKPSGD